MGELKWVFLYVCKFNKPFVVIQPRGNIGMSLNYSEKVDAVIQHTYYIYLILFIHSSH